MSAWRPVTLLALVSFTLAMAGGGAEAVCPGGRIPLDISVGSTPLVQMTLGGHPGTVLLDTGATGSAVDAATHGLAPGVTIPYLDYSFPAAARGPFRTEDMRAYRAPGGGQKGRIGTDILAKRMIEFHHDATPPFLIVGSAACDPALLRAAGLVEVGVPGNYGGDPAARRRGLPNVPVIGLRIAGFPVPAQVDSGFADIAAPGIVQVNQPLMAIRNNHVENRDAP